jgi:microcystin-dependent protein
MPKNKVSEYSPTASNNTDIGGINIAEGCAPSGINNAIRELMAQLKDMQAGTDGDDFSIGGNLAVTGTTTLTGTTAAPTPSASDDSTKIATTAFVRDIIPSGVILMWSGSIATIPAGWVLCDGSNSTPDLRNRFIVGAGSTYSVAGTGGSADAIVVSHTHTGTTGAMNSNATHSHTYLGVSNPSGSGVGERMSVAVTRTTDAANIDHTHNFTTGSTGSSGTNANLPPYYALAYIMKS